MESLYIFLPKEDKMVYLNGTGMQTLKRALPAYEQLIEAYFTSHRSIGKNNDQLINLFAYMDKH